MSSLTREQFIEEVLRIIPAKFPLVKIMRGDEPFSMRVNGRVEPLESLYRTVVLDPQDIRQHVERWVVELLRAAEAIPRGAGGFEDLKERIFPLLLSDQLASTVHRETLTQPVVPGLRVAYGIDSDRSIAYIPRIQFELWNMPLDDLHETAIDNLVGRSQAMHAQVAQDESGEIDLIIFQSGDGYDASRILLPTLHDRLREHIDSPFVAAVPNRDILLCFRNGSETVERVKSQVEEDYQRMPHQVSDKLYLITADGIAPLE